jgi:hypothetical protein
MRRTTFIVVLLFLLAGCMEKNELSKSGEYPFMDRHLKNVTQLTFEGDNGEAYFSPDGGRLIYQSNRGGYNCDKI